MQALEIRGKRVSVIGGARSGIAVARLLKSHGAEVFLSEKAPGESMQEVRAELDRLLIGYEFGGNTRKALSADILVLSPGVPSDIPVVKEAVARSKPVVSEIEVGSWFCPAPIVAVTGTNGKTTTTTLIGRMFEDAKRPSVTGGNIGVAFSQLVDRLNEQSTAILEISSFQLDHITTFRPRVSVLLNITSDHLDRYGHSFESYVASKCRVFLNQREGDCVVYNYDDPTTRDNVERRVDPTVKQLPFSTETTVSEGAYLDGDRLRVTIGSEFSDVIEVGEISIRGKHNLYNAMAATLAAKAMKISTASLRSTLRNFKGVEHRLEFVREFGGVTYVNDSKATNVDAVWYALQSFDQNIVLLLGGRDKGNDYSRLVPLVRKRVKSIVAVGESASTVVNAFSHVTTTKKATTMEEAVRIAASLAGPGEVVLLSPACASFDWFNNYEHRGRVFKEIVHSL